MKCPKCKKTIPSRSKFCKYCKVKIVRKSDKIAKKMVMEGNIAMACGGLLALIGIVLFIYGGGLWAAIMLALGALLTFIGMKMK